MVGMQFDEAAPPESVCPVCGHRRTMDGIYQTVSAEVGRPLTDEEKDGLRDWELDRFDPNEITATPPVPWRLTMESISRRLAVQAASTGGGRRVSTRGGDVTLFSDRRFTVVVGPNGTASRAFCTPEEAEAHLRSLVERLDGAGE